MDALISI